MSETDEVWDRRRTSFGSAAENYAGGRPHYPRELLEWGAPPGARTVLDLGAGTGIVTAGLLELGFDVVAVEPLEQMRDRIPAAAEAIWGTAEQIPLADSSVDAIYVGQAWHWFDEQAALAETGRVLRPGGRLVLMWNMLDAADDLAREIADITEAEERTDLVEAENLPSPYGEDPHFEAVERRLLLHRQPYDADRLERFVLSRSQTILLEPEARAALLARLRAAAPSGRFDLALGCEAWRATYR
ncbi:MAG TPA: class I SAM-dependent methyltransferase [Mycobacteriales bacterium]|nr:class I SAM-dependent methyltransferase [Mycobacteriales bacterium]